MVRAISNAQVIVNDVAIGLIVPNSVKMKLGMGETHVTAATGGGSQVTTVYSDDASTKVGEVSFDVKSETEWISFFKAIKARGDNNVVIISDNDNDFSATFQRAAMTNDLEIDLSVDGKFTVTFKSMPAML